MKSLKTILALTGLAASITLVASFSHKPVDTGAFSLLGHSLGSNQRDFRVFNNFTDSQANNNVIPHVNFPGATGAVMAIWKGHAEWGSDDWAGNGNGEGAPRVDRYFGKDVFSRRVMRERLPKDVYRKLLETVDKIRQRPNPDLQVLGVVITLHDRRTVLGRDIKNRIHEVFKDKVFHTLISKNVRLEESPAYKQSIFTFAPNSTGAMEYYKLSEEVISRG